MAKQPMRIKIDQVALRSMLRSPTGAVGRDLIRRGKLIEEEARRLAPGHMPDYVHSTLGPSLLGTNVIVYCDHPAAIFVLKGTKSHIIRSHGPWPLRNKAKGLVFGPVVHHPGTKANDFLTKAMPAGRL